MQIDQEIGTPVNINHSLSKFVAYLKDATLQESIKSARSNSVIELPEGITWLGDKKDFSNQLFLRPCYFDLLEAKEEYFKLNSELNTIVYTGTRGIGKSPFSHLRYLNLRLLHSFKPFSLCADS